MRLPCFNVKCDKVLSDLSFVLVYLDDILIFSTSALEHMLRHFINPAQNDWDVKLPCCEFAVNNAWNRAWNYSLLSELW